MAEQERIALGDSVRDPHSGLKGTVTARTERIDGQVQCEVQPRGVQESGAPLVATWLNEGRLVKCDAD